MTMAVLLHLAQHGGDNIMVYITCREPEFFVNGEGGGGGGGVGKVLYSKLVMVTI